MGLKESGLRGSLRNVSVGIDAIPDSELLQAYWPINEGSGDTVADQEGDNDGTRVGADWVSADGIDQDDALDIVGDSDVIQTPLDLSGFSELTVVMLAKTTDNDDRFQYWFSQEPDDDDNPVIFRKDDDEFRNVVETENGSVELNANSSQIVDNEWAMYSITYDGSEAAFYVDKDQQSSVSLSGEIVSSDSTFHIGNNSDGRERSLDGTAAQVHVWESGLDQSQIEQMHDQLLG